MRRCHLFFGLILRTTAFDVIGIQPTILPPLPSGAVLDLPRQHRLNDEQITERIRDYVRHGTDDDGDEIWPCAAALCRWQSRHADQIKGKSVLELGAGSGVCGVYAAACGAARVVLTDGGGPAVRARMRATVERNRHLLPRSVNVEIAHLEWAALPPKLAGPQFDWVIASDVTYGNGATAAAAQMDALARCEALISTLETLLEDAHHAPRVVIAHEHRNGRGVRDAVARWDENDPDLALFREAANRREMDIIPIASERPRATRVGALTHWTPDLSIFEVRRAAR